MKFDIRYSSLFPPSVVLQDDKFRMAFCTSNSEIMYSESDDGKTWKEAVNTEETTVGAPSIVIAENRTVIVFAAHHEVGKIRYTIRDERSERWIRSKELDAPPADRLISAVGKPNGEVIVFYRPPGSNEVHGYSFLISKQTSKSK